MALTLNKDDLEKFFEEVLDADKSVEVYGYTFSPSRILRTLDPIAYHYELGMFADSLVDCGYTIEGY